MPPPLEAAAVWQPPPKPARPRDGGQPIVTERVRRQWLRAGSQRRLRGRSLESGNILTI